MLQMEEKSCVDAKHSSSRKECQIAIKVTKEKDSIAMVLNEAVRQALTAGHLAHLVTLNDDGSPQVSVVWVGLDDDEIVCAHLGSWKKVRNVQRNPRVALSMVTGGKTNNLDNY